MQNYRHFRVGQRVGMSIDPEGIHIMRKERTANVYTAKIVSPGVVEVLGVETRLGVPDELVRSGAREMTVEIPFDGVELFDNEEDGTFTGDISFIRYKGDHYHITIDTDWGEKLYVDTQDQWDLGDHVGITIRDIKARDNK